MIAMLSSVVDSLEGAQLRGDDVQLRDATHDSRQVASGWLFCALPGERVDGHTFASDAVANGATALLVERWLDEPVAQVRVPSTRAAVGRAAATIHNWPSRAMTTIGVTGTNGKTTVTYLLESAFAAAGRASGVIGTIESRIIGVPVAAERTTPESTDLQRLLATMVVRGVDAVAMEVSSHGLDLHRVDGTAFDVGIFTNLSQDHLDWHGSMENYFAAKARLFEPDRTRTAVIVIDDPWGQRLAASTATPCITVGRTPDADVRIVSLTLGPHGGQAHVDWDGEQFAISTHLIGAFNVTNAVVAVIAAAISGMNREDAIAGVAACRRVPGRLERVEHPNGADVYVDYAHTPAAVAAVIDTVRGVRPDGKVIVVLGAGGDRDRAKRHPMGVALGTADVAVITSDNPRSEDPAAIAAEISAGVEEAQAAGATVEVVVELDRRRAIEYALQRAQPTDAVVIAGKGHERVQIIGSDVRSFDDVAVAREVLAEVPA